MNNFPQNRYIGRRYVPKFADPILWDSTKRTAYESLTIVMWEGNSYTSKMDVPVGVDITNETFWVCTGDYNAQVDLYHREVQQYRTDAQNEITEINNNFEAFKLDEQNAFNDFKTSEQTDFNTFKAEINTNFTTLENNLNTDFDELRTQEQTDFNTLRTELENMVSDTEVNAKKFGAINDCVYDGTFEGTITGTDNTQALQDAINYAIANKKNLVLEPYSNYKITDTLVIDGNLDFDGNYSRIVALIGDKTKPAFIIKNNPRHTVKNLTIEGAGYIPLAGIQFKTPDNQMFILENVHIDCCRYGVYTNEGECINRIVFKECELISNLISGVYIHSYDTTYTHSAPITFYNTICNGNGVQGWMINKTYNGVNVLEPTDKYGYQIYVKGFANLSYIGGQISCHSPSKLLALAYFENGSGLNLSNVDIEDFQYPVKEDGTDITDLNATLGAKEGGAITVESVANVSITQTHSYLINSQTFIKLLYNCWNVYLSNLDYSGSCKYVCKVVGSNDGIAPNLGRVILDFNGNLAQLDTSALMCLNKKNLNVLTHATGGLTPSGAYNNLFDKASSDGSRYVFGYYGGDASPVFTGGCYMEKVVNGASSIFAVLECTQNSFDSDGRFFIEALDTSGNRLGYQMYSTKGYGSFIGKLYSWFSFTLPANTFKVRYGFINSQNYIGNIGDHATVSGFTVYATYNHTMLQNATISLDENNNKISNAFSKNTSYADAPPSTGTYANGFTVINTTPQELGTTGTKYIIDRWRYVGSAWIPVKVLTGN